MVIYNKIIPFKGYLCINLCGLLFVRKQANGKVDDVVLNHEKIHTRQMIPMLFIFFYFWYVIEWIVKSIKYGNMHNGYRNISFEREAYQNERDMEYTKKMKPFSWWKYLRKH